MTDPKPARPLSRTRRRLAWALALAADGVQIILWPAFFAGAVSPVDDALDVAVSVAMFALLGFHPALLPAFALKLIPGIDLAPTWTIAAWAAMRGRPDSLSGASARAAASVQDSVPLGPPDSLPPSPDPPATGTPHTD